LKHHTTPNFWSLYNQLPTEIQEAADKSFDLLKSNPRHPSLQFKKIGEVWSVRVSLAYRALAAEDPDGLLWFWIGPHDEYERMI
jgi:hypothetical protein